VGAVRLGKNVLRWCYSCNLPILEEKRCTVCGSETYEIFLTPPGDCRPAFECDLERVKDLADQKFGQGCGELLLPKDRIAILNRCPSLDRMDEIIVDGEILGAVIFDPPNGEKLILRPAASKRMLPQMKKGRVVADIGALSSLASGSNLKGPGVISADGAIAKGDEITVLSPKGNIIATGSARKSGSDMASRSRGIAVKIRWTSDENKTDRNAAKPNDWEMAVTANQEHMNRKIESAKKFIRKLSKRYDKPIAVSFSGGKDSLVTLYLALESGFRPQILFVDTGLELDETLAEVERIGSETGLELLIERAENAFWEGLEVFGPPGKDFRWCCKTCKLGPTTRLISKNFPKGVVSLIGQRSYESEQRMRKGAVWQNPWTPGQIGASPIQRWTAMHVWLYIFSRNLNFNPWYTRGLDRIGCFLCPSSDLAELEIVKKWSSKYSQWESYLRSYRRSKNLPKEWETLALWRWKRMPAAMRKKLEQLGVEIRESDGEQQYDAPLRLIRTEGYRPCTEGGYSAEGVFPRKLDMEKVSNLMNIIGPVDYLESKNLARTSNVVVFGEGAVTIKGKNEQRIEELSRILEQIVIRAIHCVGCGICAGRCEQGAIQVDGKIRIDEELCSHCRECLGPCPVLRFEKHVEI